MGTRGTAYFTDSYGQWLALETRWDGHSIPAAFHAAATPFFKLARAEQQLAASMAKGDKGRVPYPWDLRFEGALKLRPAATNALLPMGPFLGKSANACAHLAGLELATFADHIERIQSWLAFGEFDAPSNARDFCSRQDRWQITAAADKPSKKQQELRDQADIVVETLDESRVGNTRITVQSDLDDAADSIAQLEHALNGPLAPYRCYRVSLGRIVDHDDWKTQEILIEFSQALVYACLLSLRSLAHPEYASGLRISGNPPAGTHADLISSGEIPATLADDNEAESATRLFLGLPMGEAEIAQNPTAKPRFGFTHTIDGHRPCDGFEDLTPFGNWRHPELDPALAAAVGLNAAIACIASDGAGEQFARSTLEGLAKSIGAPNLCAFLEKAAKHHNDKSGHLDAACSIVSQIALEQATPAPSASAKPAKSI